MIGKLIKSEFKSKVHIKRFKLCRKFEGTHHRSFSFHENHYHTAIRYLNSI